MPVLSQCYWIIINLGIIAPGHDKDVFDVLNVIDKRYIYQLMSNVKLPVSNLFILQIRMHSCTENNDVGMDIKIPKIFI